MWIRDQWASKQRIYYWLRTCADLKKLHYGRNLQLLKLLSWAVSARLTYMWTEVQWHLDLSSSSQKTDPTMTHKPLEVKEVTKLRCSCVKATVMQCLYDWSSKIRQNEKKNGLSLRVKDVLWLLWSLQHNKRRLCNIKYFIGTEYGGVIAIPVFLFPPLTQPVLIFFSADGAVHSFFSNIFLFFGKKALNTPHKTSSAKWHI